jgi:hypothetical protein
VPATDWRRVGRVVLWLFIFPPIGLWLLFRDPTLSRPTKLRILVYSVIGIIVGFTLFALAEIHLLKRALAGSGLDF